MSNQSSNNTLDFKTKPMEHQVSILKQTWDRESFALFWEMGTGKSKVIIDNAAALFLKGKIDGLLILAPKGAYLNWYYNEIPKHMSDSLDYYMAYWSSNLKKDRYREAVNCCGKPDIETLDVMCMNIESLSMGRGRDVAYTFVKNHNCMICVDESTTIKNPKASRTKACMKLAEISPYRRILSGTPITQSPLDIYAQFAFMDRDLLGFRSFFAFRTEYAMMQTVKFGTRAFNKVVGFRNLDDLVRRIDNHASRITKDECLDLPEKTFSTEYIELTKEQTKAYKEMVELCVAQFEDELITVTSALTAIVKLQQITCGHIKTDDGNVIEIPSKRVETMLDVLEGFGGKAIVWCNFVHDIVLVSKALSEVYGEESVVTYYGDTSNDDRVLACKRIQEDDTCRFMVATSAASKGLTLTAATLNLYYSHSYNLETYLQSQDRTHRIGQTRNVHNVSLVARDTVDEKVLKALRDKKDLASSVVEELRSLVY